MSSNRKQIALAFIAGLAVALCIAATAATPAPVVQPAQPLTQCQVDLQQAVMINQTLYNDYQQLREGAGKLMQEYQKLYETKTQTCPGAFITGQKTDA